jgi:hypothetical protein
VKTTAFSLGDYEGVCTAPATLVMYETTRCRRAANGYYNRRHYDLAEVADERYYSNDATCSGTPWSRDESQLLHADCFNDSAPQFGGLNRPLTRMPADAIYPATRTSLVRVQYDVGDLTCSGAIDRVYYDLTAIDCLADYYYGSHIYSLVGSLIVKYNYDGPYCNGTLQALTFNATDGACVATATSSSQYRWLPAGASLPTSATLTTATPQPSASFYATPAPTFFVIFIVIVSCLLFI